MRLGLDWRQVLVAAAIAALQAILRAAQQRAQRHR